MSSLEGVEEILTKLGIEKHKVLSDGRIVIPMQDSIVPLISSCEERGIKVLSIEEKKRTIEEYFLRLVGGDK